MRGREIRTCRERASNNSHNVLLLQHHLFIVTLTTPHKYQTVTLRTFMLDIWVMGSFDLYLLDVSLLSGGHLQRS